MKRHTMLLCAGWLLLAGGAAGCTDRSADRTQEQPPPVQNTPSGTSPAHTPGGTGTQGGGAAPTQPPGPEGAQQQQQPTGTKK